MNVLVAAVLLTIVNVGCVPSLSEISLGGEMNDEAAIRKALGAAAPKDARLRAWQGTPVPGVRLYTVEGGAMNPVGVGVVDSETGKQVLTGPSAFSTLVSRTGTADPRLIAELSVHFVEVGQAGARVIPATGAAPELTAEQAARVGPPARTGDTLVYWRWPASVANDRTHTAPEPWRCELELGPVRVRCEK